MQLTNFHFFLTNRTPHIISLHKSRFADKFIIKHRPLKSNFFPAGGGFFTGVAPRGRFADQAFFFRAEVRPSG